MRKKSEMVKIAHPRVVRGVHSVVSESAVICVHSIEPVHVHGSARNIVRNIRQTSVVALRGVAHVRVKAVEAAVPPLHHIAVIHRAHFDVAPFQAQI